MSRLLRHRRREIPSPLLVDTGKGATRAAMVEKVGDSPLSPTRRLRSTPRQLVVTIIPVQATALPTPITTILTTTRYETVTPTTTTTTTTPSVSASAPAAQLPRTSVSTDGSVIAASMSSIQAVRATTAGGGDASTTVANVAQGSNVPVIAGVAGAAGFSVLSIALFFYVRSKRAPSNRGRDAEKTNTLAMSGAQLSIAGQPDRPYSSRGRLG